MKPRLYAMRVSGGYVVTQESRFIDGWRETARVVVRSRLRATVIAKRWTGSCTRWTRADVYAYVDGIAVLPHLVPSVGELGYW